MKQEALQLTTGGKKENRRALDFYTVKRIKSTPTQNIRTGLGVKNAI